MQRFLGHFFHWVRSCWQRIIGGRENIHSIRGFTFTRFGNCFIRSLAISNISLLPCFILIFNLRTPFELNSTLRCAIIVLYETLAVTCGVASVCAMPSVLIGFMLSSEAVLLDIKSIFVQLNHLSQCNNAQRPERNYSASISRKSLKMEMVKCLKEAIQLHQKLNR